MKDSDVFECLETGAQELGTLLGYGPNTEELSCGQIIERWLNKTTGAGLTSEDAATFLAHRLAEELWELQEVHPLPVADSMSRILASFSNLKRTNGFFAGFNAITEFPMRFFIHRMSVILRRMAVAISLLDPRLKTEALSHTGSESWWAKPLSRRLKTRG